MESIKRIALFASGSGSNVENIYNYFREKADIEIACVLCNKPDAYVIERAKRLSLDVMVFDRGNFGNPMHILAFLEEKRVDLVVLAGFLWLIPKYMIDKYPNKIVNIHPALLPNYGGKGMYGDAVHKAVYENKETETGITIHYVNEKYDDGNIVFQKSVKIDAVDTPDSIADKVHKLEYEFYPTIIEKIALTL